MTVLDVTRETLLMIGITAAIGFALAYLIKLLVAAFIFFNKNELSSIVTYYKVYSRSRRIEALRIRQALETMDGNSGADLVNYLREDRNKFDRKEKVGSMYGIAGFHYSDSGKKEAEKDKEMDRLFEYHHGEV